MSIDIFALKQFLLIFIVFLGGMLVEALVKRAFFLFSKDHYKTHHFSWSKYLAYILYPIVLTIYLHFKLDKSLLGIFLGFSLFGLIGEWTLGFVYHKLMGQRLWTYHKYSIGKYTSFLVLPLWGGAGVIFWFFSKIFL